PVKVEGRPIDGHGSKADREELAGTREQLALVVAALAVRAGHRRALADGERGGPVVLGEHEVAGALRVEREEGHRVREALVAARRASAARDQRVPEEAEVV